MDYPTADLSRQLDTLVDARFDQLVDLRRQLHRYPELSWHEERTTERLRRFLEQFQIATRQGPRERGLIAELSNVPQPDEFFALRGDIDAIPVEEETGLEFESVHRGIMHACGHDVHATVLAGTLLALRDLLEQAELAFPLSVRGILQPAEEVAQGARAMIQIGALEGVRAILAIHVDSSRPIGTIGLRRGVQTAWCDEVRAVVEGEGGHGARPHETRDPIFAATQWINAVYGNFARSVDSRHPIVVSICQIQGGSTSNVVPRQVELAGTLRTLSSEAREICVKTVERISESIGLLTGTKITTHWGESVPSIDNDPELVSLVDNVARACLGKSSTEWIEPSMGSEDFAYYAQLVPGALIRVGCTPPGSVGLPLHSSKFYVDEEVIRVACRLMAKSVLQWWSQRESANGDGPLTYDTR